MKTRRDEVRRRAWEMAARMGTRNAAQKTAMSCSSWFFLGDDKVGECPYFLVLVDARTVVCLFERTAEEPVS